MVKLTPHKKLILSPGYYNVNDRNGSRRVQLLDENRLKGWADKINKLNERGLLIPAPYEHDFNAKPEKGDQKKRLSETLENGGFWTRAEYNEETKEFSAYIEPASEADEQALNNKVKGISIWAEGKYVDPFGQEWEDVPLHIALTNRPMFPQSKDKRDFVPVSEDSLSVAMSDYIESVPESSLTALVNKLKEVAKIALPESVTRESLVEVLMGALLQKGLSEQDGGTKPDLTTPPKGSLAEPGPVIMSENEMTKELEDRLAAQEKQINDLQELNKSLADDLLSQKRGQLKSRTESLVMSQVITKEYADSNLFTEIETLESPQGISTVEARIEALESVEPPKPRPAKKNNQFGTVMSEGAPDGTVETDNPIAHDPTDMTDDRLNEIMGQVLQSVPTFSKG